VLVAHPSLEVLVAHPCWALVALGVNRVGQEVHPCLALAALVAYRVVPVVRHPPVGLEVQVAWVA
jgi:ABC-type proline/glycine betaine transport system permease subunit